MLADGGLLGVELRLVRLIEEAVILPGPVAKAEPAPRRRIRVRDGGRKGGMAVRDVVGDEIEHQPHPSPAARGNQRLECGFASQGRFHPKEIARRIAVILGRCEDGRQPQGINAERRNVVELRDQSPERPAQASIQILRRRQLLTGRWGEAIDEHLVDHRPAQPLRRRQAVDGDRRYVRRSVPIPVGPRAGYCVPTRIAPDRRVSQQRSLGLSRQRRFPVLHVAPAERVPDRVPRLRFESLRRTFRLQPRVPGGQHPVADPEHVHPAQAHVHAAAKPQPDRLAGQRIERLQHGQVVETCPLPEGLADPPGSGRQGAEQEFLGGRDFLAAHPRIAMPAGGSSSLTNFRPSAACWTGTNSSPGGVRNCSSLQSAR